MKNVEKVLIYGRSCFDVLAAKQCPYRLSVIPNLSRKDEITIQNCSFSSVGRTLSSASYKLCQFFVSFHSVRSELIRSYNSSTEANVIDVEADVAKHRCSAL